MKLRKAKSKAKKKRRLLIPLRMLFLKNTSSEDWLRKVRSFNGFNANPDCNNFADIENIPIWVKLYGLSNWNGGWSWSEEWFCVLIRASIQASVLLFSSLKIANKKTMKMKLDFLQPYAVVRKEVFGTEIKRHSSAKYFQIQASPEQACDQSKANGMEKRLQKEQSHCDFFHQGGTERVYWTYNIWF